MDILNALTILLFALPCLLVGFVIFKQSKVVAAFAQLNDLQERSYQQDNLVRKAISIDKHWFILGVSNVAVSAYILGAFPAIYYAYYTPKVLCLILLRLYTFYQKKQHFLLWDFCYWANFLCMAYCWFLSTDFKWFQVVFMCANGPLAWSVLAFNHSLIFHSFAHVTSVVVHVSPLILTYGIRWYTQPLVNSGFGFDHFTICASEDDCQKVSPYELVFTAMTRFYIWWLVLYYVWIFVVLGKYIEERSYQTLWDRILVMKPVGPILKGMLQRFPKLLVQGVYLVIHLFFSIVTMLVACLLWYNQVAHFAFLVMISLSTIKNAATFYFEVFEGEYAKVAGEGSKSGMSKKLVAASATLGKMKEPIGCA